jgi:CRP/FNR family transcriptional regulator, cyclic AMP receptor protein
MTLNDQSGFLETLTAEHRREIQARARTVRVGKGQTLLAHGETSNQVFIVMSGRVQVVIHSMIGREVSFRELAEGELFGEIAAIDGGGRSVSIVALSDVRLMAIARSDFIQALRASPDSSEWMMRRLTARIRNLTDKVFELAALNVQERLHRELLRLGRDALATGAQELCPAPTHQELANRIGTHREAVTREIKALSDRGVIGTGRRRLEFLDLPHLEELVARAGQRSANEE